MAIKMEVGKRFGKKEAQRIELERLLALKAKTKIPDTGKQLRTKSKHAKRVRG